jgi:hypothetical protein
LKNTQLKATHLFQTDTSSFQWHYEFHKVSVVSSAVFGYAWITPALLYFAVWWLGTKSGSDEPGGESSGLTFLELLCVYGYSLAVFVPLSVLWLIQVLYCSRYCPVIFILLAS